MIKLMRGRYGPYVTDGSTNATIPRDSDPLIGDARSGGGADRGTRGQGRRQEAEEGREEGGCSETGERRRAEENNGQKGCEEARQESRESAG